MQFISRSEQLARRPWDPFSPLRRTKVTQSGLLALETEAELTDSLLDGIPLSSTAGATQWLDETQVHHGRVLSVRMSSTAPFLGPQVIAGRDDVRKLSHILVVESSQLVLVTTELMEERERRTIMPGLTRRAHLTIDKYTGAVRVVHATDVGDARVRLYLNGTEIDTTSNDVDFPFLVLAQVPIGHVQPAPPSFGLLSYKCRQTGRNFLRSIDESGAVGPERPLECPPTVGGVDFAISNDSVMLRIDAVVDGALRTMIAMSTDRGESIGAFGPIDLGEFAPDAHLPATSPVFQDYNGNFHVPVATLKDSQRHLFDAMSDVAVETMILSPQGHGYTLARFPKKPQVGDSKGRGDGVTDGAGIIATAVDAGRLLVSNSQAGGISYPLERLLNHEMPLAFAFKATECCYTRGTKPNTVSMDYLFLEADAGGSPVSSRLFLETWDMPLPYPQVEASAAGNQINIRILKDAWFESAKTIFALSDPKISIISVELIGEREATLTCSTDDLRGATVSFETKTLFYWHAAECVVS